MKAVGDAIGSVGAAVPGPVFFDETLTPARAFWLAVIIAGVIWLKLADSPEAENPVAEERMRPENDRYEPRVQASVKASSRLSLRKRGEVEDLVYGVAPEPPPSVPSAVAGRPGLGAVVRGRWRISARTFTALT